MMRNAAIMAMSAGACMAMMLAGAPDALAVYPAYGLLASSNLLAGEGTATIGSFSVVVSSLPAGRRD